MNRLQEALARTARAIDRTGLDWALVGGLAVSARCEPRFTRDLDLAVGVASDASAEDLVRSLVRDGYATLASLEQLETGRLATVRLQPPAEASAGVVVDLLFASSGIEPELAASATPMDVFPGLRVKVALVEHLLALKVLARDDRRRPQDRVDIQALLQVATPDQMERARQALRLVMERRFNRSRQLLADLEAAVSELGPQGQADLGLFELPRGAPCRSLRRPR